nr:Asp-tRNA(Asn)/Glu-tRNA(Gln) amidotransferase subunit GatC [Tissierella sp.]
MIDKKEIQDLADLCKLNLTQGETLELEKELNLMLDEVEAIKEVDTRDIDITYNVNAMKNPLRKEKAWESLSREEVLKNTSEAQYGYFKILKVVD